MKEGYTVEPEWRTPNEMAMVCRWEPAKAEFMCEQLRLRGMVEARDGLRGNEYRITGLGLAMGEKMGAVIPLDEVISPAAKN